MHLVFLPGGSGAPEFWYPLGALLPLEWRKTYLSWPGLGNQAPNPAIQSFDDLVAWAEKAIDEPAVLVAQSLGGVVGLRLALQYPNLVAGLVLVATSGGVDVASLGGEDWRPAYLEAFPQGARWITTERPDHTHDLARIAVPTLLLWGENDAISPVAVGRHFQSLLPSAQLHVVKGGDHFFAKARAAEIAPLITDYLTWHSRCP